MALESPTHLTIGRSLGGVSKLFDTEASPFPVKFRQAYTDVSQRVGCTDTPKRSELDQETCRMSSTFQEVLKTYNTEPITVEGLKAESRMDTIMDAFRKGESMLLSSDNLRPKSRCKTTLQDIDYHRKAASFERPQSFNNSLKSHSIRHFSPDTNLDQIPLDVNGKNISNNAVSTEKFVCKKENKKYRKRSKSEGKSKRNKQSKPHIQSPAKYSSTQSVFPQSNSHVSRRISSEPTSKNFNSSTFSNEMQGMGTERHKLKALSINNTRSTKDFEAPARISIKCKNSHSNSTVVTHYTHGIFPNCNHSLGNDLENGLIAQGMPVAVHKTDIRIKSGHSSRSEEVHNTPGNSECMKLDNHTDENVQSDHFLVLNAKPCNVHRTKNSVSPIGSQGKHLQPVLSADMASRQASLEAIYGAMHNTANRITAQVEELKKVKKIFLSDRQSGTIRESGTEYPCAPPATPTPDVMKKYEYVPSMADIRSQRAVKGRLQAMEKDAQKKKEKQRETAAKLEKQQLKDREKILKAKQRKEIYALNKMMTDLEHKRFLEFCKAKGLNKT